MGPFRMFQLLLTALIFFASGLHITIVSDSNPQLDLQELKDQISYQFPQDLSPEIQVLHGEPSKVIDSISYSTDVIVNASLATQLEIAIEQYVNTMNIPYFGRNLILRTRFNYQLVVGWEKKAQALSQFLTEFEWNNFGYLYGMDSDNLNTFSYLDSMFESYSFTIGEGNSSGALDLLIGRNLKANGVKLYLIDVTENIAERIRTSMVSMKVHKKGTAHLNYSSFLPANYLEGDLYILPSYASSSISTEQSLAKSLWIYLENFISNPQNDHFVSRGKLLQFLNDAFPNREPIFQFDIVNAQGTQLVKVGYIDETGVIIDSTIVYPGQTYEHPNKSKQILPISSSISNWDPLWFPNDHEPSVWKQSENPTVEYYNNSNEILEHFDLKLTDIKCGHYNSPSPFVEQCIAENKDNFGLYYSGPVTLESCKPQLETLQAQEINIPVVGSLTTQTEFESLEKYKLFVQIAALVRDYSRIMAEYLIAMHYQNVCYIGDFLFDQMHDESFPIYKLARLNVMNIENKDDWYLPVEFQADLQILTNLVSNILSFKCRIIVARIHPN